MMLKSKQKMTITWKQKLTQQTHKTVTQFWKVKMCSDIIIKQNVLINQNMGPRITHHRKTVWEILFLSHVSSWSWYCVHHLAQFLSAGLFLLALAQTLMNHTHKHTHTHTYLNTHTHTVTNKNISTYLNTHIFTHVHKLFPPKHLTKLKFYITRIATDCTNKQHLAH